MVRSSDIYIYIYIYIYDTILFIFSRLAILIIICIKAYNNQYSDNAINILTVRTRSMSVAVLIIIHYYTHIRKQCTHGRPFSLRVRFA
jgi:hypothetical protein